MLEGKFAPTIRCGGKDRVQPVAGHTQRVTLLFTMRWEGQEKNRKGLHTYVQAQGRGVFKPGQPTGARKTTGCCGWGTPK